MGIVGSITYETGRERGVWEDSEFVASVEEGEGRGRD